MDIHYARAVVIQVEIIAYFWHQLSHVLVTLSRVLDN
jgi:hypothetical protein